MLAQVLGLVLIRWRIGPVARSAQPALVVDPGTSAARLRAHGELLRLCEATLESARGGAIALESGPVNLGPGFAQGPLPELELSLAVRPTATDHLHEVTVQARCIVNGAPVLRTLQTMIWSAR